MRTRCPWISRCSSRQQSHSDRSTGPGCSVCRHTGAAVASWSGSPRSALRSHPLVGHWSRNNPVPSDRRSGTSQHWLASTGRRRRVPRRLRLDGNSSAVSRAPPPCPAVPHRHRGGAAPRAPRPRCWASRSLFAPCSDGSDDAPLGNRVSPDPAVDPPPPQPPPEDGRRAGQGAFGSFAHHRRHHQQRADDQPGCQRGRSRLHP